MKQRKLAPSHLFRRFSSKINRDSTGRIIIAGSGITSLCTAALLTKLGYRVTVLEVYPELIGGHARSIEAGGLRFCVGPQFVWNFSGNPDMVGEKVFRFLGLYDAIKLIPYDENCQDKLFLGSETGIDIPRGLLKFRQVMTQQFPQEKENLNRFFSCIDSLFQGSKLLHDKGLYLQGEREMLFAILFSSHLSIKTKLIIARFHNKTLEELFDFCALSEKPRRLLFGHGGIFAENAENISVGVYAAATGYCHLGISFPLNGFHKIIEELHAFIINHGGYVYLNKKVNQFNIRGTKIVSVTCADDSVYPCDYVISNLSPRLTRRLISQKNNVESFRYKPSNSMICCFIGVDKNLNLNNIVRKNFWWQAYPEKVNYDNPDMTKEPTMIFVGSETANGVLYNDINPQLQSLTIFAPGNFTQAKSAYENDPKKHDELRSEIEQNILSVLEKRLFPNLRQSIKFVKVFTPWDIYQELGAEEGNVYGRKEDVVNVLRKINQIRGIDNLSIACATVGQPGIATGFQTALVLVKKLTGNQI